MPRKWLTDLFWFSCIMRLQWEGAALGLEDSRGKGTLCYKLPVDTNLNHRTSSAEFTFHNHQLLLIAIIQLTHHYISL